MRVPKRFIASRAALSAPPPLTSCDTQCVVPMKFTCRAKRVGYIGKLPIKRHLRAIRPQSRVKTLA
jgi:hypothetical protein